MEQTTVQKLMNVVNNTLPQAKNTGLSRHLMPVMKSTHKGKAVIFTWNKSQFRVSDKLAVKEQDFTGQWIDTPDAKNIQTEMKAKFFTM